MSDILSKEELLEFIKTQKHFTTNVLSSHMNNYLYKSTVDYINSNYSGKFFQTRRNRTQTSISNR